MTELTFDTNVEVTPELPAQELTISTSMVEIKFKKAVLGDTVVDAGRGVLPLNIINGVADQHIQQMARLVYEVQAAVEGLEAIGSKTVQRPSTYFDQGIMREEWRQLCTETQVVRAERLWAEFLAHWQAVKELIAERAAKFSTQAQMQFGYVGALGAQHGFKRSPLYDANQALAYRMATYTKRLTAQLNHQAKENTAGGGVSIRQFIAS
jgi:hypothetical protein